MRTIRTITAMMMTQSISWVKPSSGTMSWLLALRLLDWSFAPPASGTGGDGGTGGVLGGGGDGGLGGDGGCGGEAGGGEGTDVVRMMMAGARCIATVPPRRLPSSARKVASLAVATIEVGVIDQPAKPMIVTL